MDNTVLEQGAEDVYVCLYPAMTQNYVERCVLSICENEEFTFVQFCLGV